MMKVAFRFLTLLIFLFATSCDAPNALTEYSSADKESALLYAAKKAVDNSQWDRAIEIITQEMELPERQKVSSKETLMHAYGGKCGIRFFDLVNQLKNANTGTVFQILLKLYANKSLNNLACEQSYLTLQSMGDDPQLRSKSSNIYAALLGMTQVSATLKSKFDLDNQGAGDGYADGSIDACDNISPSAPLKLTDNDVKTIGVGVGLFLQNISAIKADIAGGSIVDSLTHVQSLCAAPIDLGGIVIPPEILPQDAFEPINCLTTKLEDVKDKNIRLLRRMIESSAYGFAPARYSGNPCDITALNLNQTDAANPRLEAQCCPALAVP
ncbi:hypothetical protein BDW_11520 [Bdellovibrio bacteriovorus W]|nr:hypothetical protein BDW_11520 [Bdellovibrio bacteriovorus W]